MAVIWRLKTYLATNHKIHTGTALQKRVVKSTGIIISLQNLCTYLREKPKNISLKTMEIICSAFDCKLSDFCEVKPGKVDPSKVQKLSYKNTPLNKRSVKNFPDPKDYE